MHAVTFVHDTPERVLLVAPLGLGVDWIAQVLPFQRATSAPVLLAPTAVHALAAVHDTDDRLPPPLGLGVVWMLQLVPFQRSASGSCVLPK